MPEIPSPRSQARDPNLQYLRKPWEKLGCRLCTVDICTVDIYRSKYIDICTAAYMDFVLPDFIMDKAMVIDGANGRILANNGLEGM